MRKSSRATIAPALPPEDAPQPLEVCFELRLEPALDDRDQHLGRETARLGVQRLCQPRATAVGLEHVGARDLDAVGLERRLRARRRIEARDLHVEHDPAGHAELLRHAGAGAERAVDVIALEVGRPLRDLVLIEQPRKDLGRRLGKIDGVREAGHAAEGYPPAGLGPREVRSGTTSAICPGSSPRIVATSRSRSAIRRAICFSASAIGSGKCTQSASGPSGLRPSMRTGWPGLPTTVEFGGTSWMTTVLATIIAPWATVIGPSRFPPLPFVRLSCTVGWRLPVSKPVPPSVTP